MSIQTDASIRNLDRQDRLAREYGVNEQGMPVGPEYHSEIQHDNMTLGELAAQGGKITRVRVLASKDWGYWMGDISYIHGTTPDGVGHHIHLDFDSMGVPMKQMKGRFIDWAKEEKVFAKGLGLLDEGNWCILWG